MSAANSSMSPITLPPPPPPGTNYIAVISDSLFPLMVGQTLGSMLIPIVIAVFFFSTTSMRRSVMFWSNVLVLLLGITASALNAYLEVNCSSY